MLANTALRRISCKILKNARIIKMLYKWLSSNYTAKPGLYDASVPYARLGRNARTPDDSGRRMPVHSIMFRYASPCLAP